jgi:branched-chain amino acid transport system permease protein
VSELLQQIVNGLSTGCVYAALALAISVVYQGAGILNFAQGEMAAVAAYSAWSLNSAGWPIWATLPLVLTGSAVLGAVIQRILIRPVEGASPLALVTVSTALLLGVNGLVTVLWGTDPYSLASPFGTAALGLGEVTVTAQQLGGAVTVLAVMTAVGLFFRFSDVGLRMKAVAQNPDSAVLLGIRPGVMRAAGWALAAAVGAFAGVVAAPATGVNPEMMQAPLLMAFAAAALGGFGSRMGAVVGGIALGVLTALAARYIPGLTGDLALSVPFGVIFLILLLRPHGLFSRASAVRA